MTAQPNITVDGDNVVIRASKCMFVVSAADLVRLLVENPAAYVEAMRRGKAERRAEATAGREVAR